MIRGSVPSFSPKPTNEAVDLSQASVDDKLLGLLGPYHQHAISTFNTCSRGPTYRSLTDTVEGYNLGGAGSSHTTPRPSQLVISPFHQRAPPGLKLSNNSLPSEPEKGTNTKSLEWEPPLDFYCTLSSKPSVTKPCSTKIGLTRVIQKVAPNATRLSLHSYRLNAQSSKT
jgi:hypothetical protein